MKRARNILLLLVILGGFSACVPKETITDVFYIHNDLDREVIFEFTNQVTWDDCSDSTQTYTRVNEGQQTIVLPAQSTIRLHPICREYANPASHQIAPYYIIGERTQLFVDADTISWRAPLRSTPPTYRLSMFTSDTVWSIYNTQSWQTVQDNNLPYTYYHTFSVTESDLERRSAL